MIKLRQTLLLGYSLFPKTEIKLKMNKEYQEIIEKYTDFRDTEYRTITDFLFCEIFPQWKKYCMDYYYDDGPRLKDDRNISLKQINAFDTILSEYVLEALIKMDFKEYTWEQFKISINDILLLG